MPPVVYVTGSEAKETAVAISRSLKKSGYTPVVISRSIVADGPKDVLAFNDPAVAEDHARVNPKAILIRV